MTADARVTTAREYLDGARRRKVTELPPTLLIRECAELRRLLGQVLDAIGEGALLTTDQLETVLLALREARDVHVRGMIGCADCDAAESAGLDACERHQPDDDQADRYTALGELLAGEATP
jgi:hypothetical protein